MKTAALIIAASLVALPGCASRPKLGSVIPQPDGMYSATGYGKSNKLSLDSALLTAKKTCGAIGLRHIVTNQKATSYKGIVPETTNSIINKAGDIAESTGTWVPSLSGDEDYQVTLEFKCE